MGKRLRYDPDRVVEAVGLARGDGRYFLVVALTEMPVDRREDVLSQVLDKELRPEERLIVLAELARLRPRAYVGRFIETGLRSRSINVQQMTVATLPTLVGDGLSTELGEQVEGCLRHRLANKRRENTWATWEIPAVAQALVPFYGIDRIVALVAAVEPRMQREERERWRSLEQTVGDPQAFSPGLDDWKCENIGEAPDPDPRDLTADVYVDRVMKRLGYRPANPESQVYDSLAEFDVPTYVIDVGAERNDPKARAGYEHGNGAGITG